MAITFFGVATSPADSSGQTGATVTITPPASMQDGDLVLVSVRRRSSTGTWSNTTTGGQAWFELDQYDTTNIRARLFWCRFNGTWAADPVFTITGTSAVDGQMLVFRPTSAAHTWSLDAAQDPQTYTAPGSPFTVTITGRTTVAASTVTLAAWHSVDNNTWGTLSGTGWSKTSLGAQYRNTNNSSTYAYYIATSAATNVPNVSQNQASLGGDAGSTLLVTFAETLVTAAIEGVSATLAAGSLGIALATVGLAGIESAVSAGSTTVVEGSGTSVAPEPDGAEATAQIGTLAPIAVALVAPSGAGIGATAAALVPHISAAPAGVSASAAAGDATGAAASEGAVAIASVVANAAAGSLGGATTTAGIAGAEATAAAGTAAVSSGGIVLGAGQPSSTFATAQAGAAAIATADPIQGVSLTVTAEEIGASVLSAEIDGVSSTASAGEIAASLSVPLSGVQASASAGSLATFTSAAPTLVGVQSVSAVGTVAGLTEETGGAVAEGVESEAQVGAAQADGTTLFDLEGVEIVASVNDVGVQAGDNEPAETFPSGVAATAQVGAISTGEALASPGGVESAVLAGSFSVVVAIPYPLDRPDSISVVPMFEATVSVEPQLTADLVRVIPAT